MSNTVTRLAAGVFAVLVLAGTYNVASARAQSTGKKTLISTQCKQGTITQCGEEPARVECSRSWKLDFGWLTETFGIGISEVKCVEMGRVTLYKDYYSAGSGNGMRRCMSIQTAPGDITVVTPSEMSGDAEPYFAEEESC